MAVATWATKDNGVIMCVTSCVHAPEKRLVFTLWEMVNKYTVIIAFYVTIQKLITINYVAP